MGCVPSLFFQPEVQWSLRRSDPLVDRAQILPVSGYLSALLWRRLLARPCVWWVQGPCVALCPERFGCERDGGQEERAPSLPISFEKKGGKILPVRVPGHGLIVGWV